MIADVKEILVDLGQPSYVFLDAGSLLLMDICVCGYFVVYGVKFNLVWYRGHNNFQMIAMLYGAYGSCSLLKLESAVFFPKKGSAEAKST